MFKNSLYRLILLIDKIFIYFQYIIIRSYFKKKKTFTLINAGWGQLVQSIFYLNLLHKKNISKMIIILDYEKFNLSIENFTKNCKIIKIFSIFIILNKNFSQYPKNFEIKIKRYCKKIFANSYEEMDDIIYNKERTFFNKKIISRYLAKKISKNKIFSWSLHSLNDHGNHLKKNVFEPNQKTKKKIESTFNLKIRDIKESINICVRNRNKSKKNADRTNYLRDGNIDSFKYIINFLLKNYDFRLFLTGDIDDIDINHKNFFTYKKFNKKISRNFYQLSVQTLSKFHIMNSGGASKIMEFNNCKFLFIDVWPPINFTINSVLLFKNIFDKKNKYLDSFKYLKMYENNCKKEKARNSFKKSKEIFLKFYEAENYRILNNSKDQIISSLKEFLIFINKTKRLNLKNNCYKKVPSYFRKILLENKCFLSSGNLKFKF